MILIIIFYYLKDMYLKTIMKILFSLIIKVFLSAIFIIIIKNIFALDYSKCIFNFINQILFQDYFILKMFFIQFVDQYF